ncbi:MAG: hypothetical protein JO062_10485 [Bryobacterales bacterium]|nr:hypothetical protein [Bryobacterales bacterium]
MKRIRVGLLIESGPAESWLYELIEQLGRIPFLEWSLFTIPATTVPTHPLMRRYPALERAPRKLDFLPPPHLLTVKDGQLTLESCDSIRGAQLDVLLAPAPGRLRGDCEGLARNGVWSFEIEDTPLGAGNFGLFRSYERNASDFCIGLVRQNTELRSGARMLTVQPRFQFEFYDDWRAEALLSLAVPVCIELLRMRCDWPLDQREEAPMGEPFAKPSQLRTIRVFSAKAVRYVRARIRREGAPREWFILWHYGDGRMLPDRRPNDWREFTGFPEHEAADPFPCAWAGKEYLFYEDVVPPNGHGRLAVVPFENGCPGTPRVILEKPYHLSYPCVFEHEGQMWMIPESAENNTVELYRAKNFPFEWTREAALAEDVSFVDTTPVVKGGQWFFFTTSSLPGGVLASFLFSAETNGPWILHPCNPVSLSPDNSRGAGRILERDGGLIRPVQDCALGYGYAIRINQILELTSERFSEKQIARILPTWRRSIVGTHTFNSDGVVEVTDARRYKH